MRKRPFHLVRPPANEDHDDGDDVFDELDDDDDDDELDVIASYDRGYSFVQLAIDLWRIAGESERVEAAERALTTAYHSKPPHLERAGIAALLASLEGLEDALKRTVTDDSLRLSMAKVVELRGQDTELWLGEERGELAKGAIQEALIYVGYARDILNEALEKDAWIYFD